MARGDRHGSTLIVTAGFDGDWADAAATLRRVVGLAGVYRRDALLMVGGNLGAAAAALLTPWLLGRAVDILALTAKGEGASERSIAMIAFGLIVAAVSRGLLQMLGSYSGERIGQSVARDLRLAYFSTLQRLGYGFHDRIDAGDLITRGMLDIEGVRGFIEMGVQRIVQIALLFVAGGIVLAMADPVMAVVTLLCVPIIGFRAGRMGLRLRVAWTRLQREMAVLTRVMEENLHGARVVRTFAAADHELARFDEAAERALTLSNDRIRIRAGAMAAINATFFASMLVVLAVGAWRIDQGVLTIGQLTLCLAFMTVLQMPVRQMSMVMNSAARAVSSGGRVFEILDRESEVLDRPDAVPLASGSSSLAFEKVCFRYDDDGPWVLDGVSFTLEPGETLGIVGASGAGKTTLAGLAARFYDPIEGRVLIDDRDIRMATLDSVRNAVHVVHQDIFLFDDAAIRNIDYAEPDAGEDVSRAAAKLAQLDGHLAGLPAGYATRVGERGVALSGGQRQRMTIARGIVANPQILILDDATSALDAGTEAALREGLQHETASRSTIIISHRLSSLTHADEIIVLEQGRIVERGTHDMLVAANGRYADLYRHQTGWLTDEPVAAL